MEARVGRHEPPVPVDRHRRVRVVAVEDPLQRHPDRLGLRIVEGASSSSRDELAQETPRGVVPKSTVDIPVYVSEGTVKTHVGRILAKLALRDRVQAVVCAYGAGLTGTGRQPGRA